MASKKKYPPGPSFLAAAKEVSKTACLCLNLQNFVNRYGNICQTPGPFGYYILNDPDYIEYVFKVNPENYVKTDMGYQGLSAILGLNLLTNPDYGSWLSQRKLLQPLFHYHHLAHYAPIIIEKTMALCQRWHQFAKQQQPINLIPEMFTLLSAILADIFFSGDSAEYSEDFLQFIDVGSQYIKKILFLYSWLPTPLNKAFKKSKKHIHQIIADLIEKRRRQPKKNTSADLIATLLTDTTLTDQYLIDEIKTFMVTGAETTSTALSWLWYCLATNPAANDCLQQELTTQLNGALPTTANMENLTYTRMVFEETLRLYPSIWTISRRAVADDRLGDYFVPARKTIVASPFITQRHPDYWDNPAVFNPLNFSEENKKKRLKYTYFPFGLGARACIGSALAIFEAQLIIPIIAQQFEFELLAKEPIGVDPVITLRPVGGIWVRVKSRKM